MTLPDRLYLREWPNDARSVHDEPGEGRVAYVRADAFTLTPKLPTSEADEAIVDALVRANMPKATEKTKLRRARSIEEIKAFMAEVGELPSVLASAEAYEPEKKE